MDKNEYNINNNNKIVEEKQLLKSKLNHMKDKNIEREILEIFSLYNRSREGPISESSIPSIIQFAF